mmetsp:Transcript_21684/g.68697  ORF Transcript_21684/g.68697 Transcript_21684/m.68697 type:complete len:216 (-) Transcript_21684:5-652(-)
MTVSTSASPSRSMVTRMWAFVMSAKATERWGSGVWWLASRSQSTSWLMRTMDMSGLSCIKERMFSPAKISASCSVQTLGRQSPNMTLSSWGPTTSPNLFQPSTVISQKWKPSALWQAERALRTKAGRSWPSPVAPWPEAEEEARIPESHLKWWKCVFNSLSHAELASNGSTVSSTRLMPMASSISNLIWFNLSSRICAPSSWNARSMPAIFSATW